MKWIIPVMLIGALMIGFPASAEFYKYYDEDGNVHFTDDYNKVPADQREEVEGYEESISEELSSEEAEEAEETAETEEQETEASAEESEIASTEAYDVDKKVGEFDQRKAEMEQEYQGLVKEKERLEQMRKDVKTQKQGKKYNEDVKALNQRMQEHDEKRRALISEIEAHNARLAKEKAEQKQKPTPKKPED